MVGAFGYALAVVRFMWRNDADVVPRAQSARALMRSGALRRMRR